jgi:predicted nucleic acid-binding protein
MKKVFVDTNILVDLIADRRPFSKFAIQIFSKAEERKIKLYTSSHSIAIDQDVIKKGLKSKHKDFEDALQIISAYSIDKLDCIVTRNTKDFKSSEIPVLTPDELTKYL